MVLSFLGGGKISSRWLTSVDKSTFVTYALFFFFFLLFYLLLQVKKRRREAKGERGDFRWGLEIVAETGVDWNFFLSHFP